jgi:hypothetical protein
LLLLSVVYGYFVGNVANSRAWSNKKLQLIAALPFLLSFLILQIAFSINHQKWANFLSIIGVVVAVFAMKIAMVVARPGD